MAQYSMRHYIAINALPSRKTDSSFSVSEEVKKLRERFTISRVTYRAVLYLTDVEWIS